MRMHEAYIHHLFTLIFSRSSLYFSLEERGKVGIFGRTNRPIHGYLSRLVREEKGKVFSENNMKAKYVNLIVTTVRLPFSG